MGSWCLSSNQEKSSHLRASILLLQSAQQKEVSREARVGDERGPKKTQNQWKAELKSALS